MKSYDNVNPPEAGLTWPVYNGNKVNKLDLIQSTYTSKSAIYQLQPHKQINLTVYLSLVLKKQLNIKLKKEPI